MTLSREPITTLDARFSDADTVATDWSATERALQTADIFWLTTVRADGRPHVSPLVAIWFDGGLHFSTGAEEQKAINLRANPNVVVTTGCNDWQSGLDVAVEGAAIRQTDDAILQQLPAAWCHSPARSCSRRNACCGAAISRWSIGTGT